MGNTNNTKTEVARLTPELARNLLDNMAPNRNVSRRYLQRMVNARLRDEFHDTGDPIRLDSTGKVMLDGQHRCHMVIKTGMPIMVRIVRISDEARYVIDTGKPRTTSDSLRMYRDCKDCGTISAALQMAYRYAVGSIIDNTIMFDSLTVLRMFDRYQRECTEDVRPLGQCRRAKIIHSHAIFLHIVTEPPIDRTVFGFVHDATNNDHPANAAVALRASLTRRMSSGTIPSQARISMTLRAWNAWVNGETLERVYLTAALPTIEYGRTPSEVWS